MEQSRENEFITIKSQSGIASAVKSDVDQLYQRLTENINEFKSNWLLNDPEKLIEDAALIADVMHVYNHMMERQYTEQEVSYLLKFQNPLDVVSDHWAYYEILPDAMDALIAEIVNRQDDLSLFPLITDERTPDNLCKFMNVDLEKALPQIMEQKTAFYQSDLNFAFDAMREGIRTGDPDKQNFVVYFRSSGVECMNERDLLIGGTRNFNTCQFYHTQTTEPVLAYSIELVGSGENGLRGNLYQQDNHRLAEFVARAASSYKDVTITFDSGETLKMPEQEFLYTPRVNLETEHGKILFYRNESEDEIVVQTALQREHSRRENMPRGSFPIHLKELREQRIQAEADRIVTALQSRTEPNSPDKTQFMARISPYFLPLASEMDINYLFQKVRFAVKQPISISTAEGREGKFFFMRRVERSQEQPEKPSIKNQLAAKPVPGDNPPAKNKDWEVR